MADNKQPRIPGAEESLMTIIVENQEIVLEPEISQRVETLAALYETSPGEMANRLLLKGLAALDAEDGIPE